MNHVALPAPRLPGFEPRTCSSEKEMDSSSFVQHRFMTSFRTRLLLTTLALLVGLPAAVSAQEVQEVRSVLSGRVVDLASSTVVAGADVFLLDTEYRTTTDDSGAFRFSDLAPGAYIVEVRQPGYETHRDEIDLNAGETLEVRFTIGIDAIPLEPITVVARSGSIGDDANIQGRRFDGMSRPEIEEVLGRVSTMADLIREARTPGVTVVNMSTWVCAEHGRVTRRVRTANGTDACRSMSVYVDGIRSQTPGETLQDLVPETIERFEILGPMQGTVLYGQDAESGVIVIETQRGGRRLGEPLILYSHDAPRWTIALGAVGTNPTFTHNGIVLVSFPGGSTSSLYSERSAWRGGFRAAAAMRVHGYHRFGFSTYGVTGSSTGRYSSIQFGRGPTIQTRGHKTVGMDFTYQPRLTASESYDVRFEIGPTWSWQRIRLSEGHIDEWADPVGNSNPPVNWRDRTWSSFGAVAGLQLTWFLDQHWSWFAGARLRALYYGDMQSWEFQNIEDIVQQTGNIVFLDYHQPLALHPAFSFGLSWRPSAPSSP